MNKLEFARRVWKTLKQEYDVSFDQTQFWVEAIANELANAILDEEVVRFPHVGKFARVKTEGAKHWDLSGELKKAEPHYAIRFYFSPMLRKAAKLELTSEQFREWIAKTNALRRGETIEGWELLTDNFGYPVDRIAVWGKTIRDEDPKVSKGEDEEEEDDME